MDGRHPMAVALTLTACTDPAHEGVFNAWYTRVHIPDIVASGLVTHVTRFSQADPTADTPPYLALEELADRDLAQADQGYADLILHLEGRGRMFEGCQVVRRSAWGRIGGQFAATQAGRSKTTGLFIIESTCTTATRDVEFNAWYDHTHIPDLLATGLFHTAHRFYSKEGRGGGKYLAIYETVGDPLDAVTEFTRNHRPKLKAAGRLSNLIEITWRGIYRRFANAGATRPS